MRGLLITISLLAAVAASGQNTDTLSLEGTTVTSLKLRRNVFEIPASVNIVTSLDAKEKFSPTVADILKKEPGLSKGGDGVWATNINVRGLGENRLVTLIDGNRVETATDLTVSMSMIDVNDIERVEVIKGAQSSIFGTGAIGGIINIITKGGHFAQTPYFKGSAAATCSSANNGHGEYLSLSGGGSRWYIKANAAFGQARDMKTPEGYLPNSGYNNYNIGTSAAFKPVSGQCMKLQFQRNSTWNAGIPGGASFSPAATASYKNADRTLVSIGYDIEDITPLLKLIKVKTFYHNIIRNVEMLPNSPVPESGPMPVKVLPNATHTTFGCSAESSWKFNDHNEFTGGLEFWERMISSERQKFIDQYGKGSVTSQLRRYEKPLPNASSISAGVFAQDEIRFLDGRLTTTFGVRADLNAVRNEECHNVEYIENITSGVVNPNPPGKFVTFKAGKRTNPSWSGNAGLLFKTGDRCALSFNVSRSYRSPALEELFKFIDLSGNKVHFGNPDLKSEKGWGSDLGVRFTGEKLNFQVSAFSNFIRDMIVERLRERVIPDSVNDTLVLDNTSKALLYGFDYSISYEIVKGLDIYSSGSCTVGKEISGNNLYLPMIPPANAIAGISYENERILGASIEFCAAGAKKTEKIAEGERPTEAWYRLDLAAHSRIFSFSRCNFQLFTGIDNLTNVEYTNFLSTNRGNIICEPGRNFYFRINVTF